MQLLLIEGFGVQLFLVHWVKVGAVRLELDALDNFLREKFLLPLLALPQEYIVKSLFDVLSELKKLVGEGLDQHVIFRLNFGSAFGSGLVLEKVLNQQRLHFSKVIQWYNLIDHMFN